VTNKFTSNFDDVLLTLFSFCLFHTWDKPVLQCVNNGSHRIDRCVASSQGVTRTASTGLDSCLHSIHPHQSQCVICCISGPKHVTEQ